MRRDVFILFGPTASGKTDIVERLFCDAPGPFAGKAEIISADSMQVYRGMDIGTAKPDAALRAKLPHHLLDIREPNEQFNTGDFVRLAALAAREIAGRGKLPVISGGTGFYINNLLNGLPESPPADSAIRAALKAELAANGAAALMNELAARDPVSAERIHINDSYRLLRALEVCRLTGKPFSSFRMNAGKSRIPPTGHTVPDTDVHTDADARAGAHADVDADGLTGWRFFVSCLSRDRDNLPSRIHRRFSLMMRAGLYHEARALFARGFTPDDPGLKAIGYNEFFYKQQDDAAYHIVDESKLAVVEELIAKDSRNYAKRQITYFKNVAQTHWYHIDADTPPETTTALIQDDISRFLDGKDAG